MHADMLVKHPMSYRLFVVAVHRFIDQNTGDLAGSLTS
jgi:hypothetical protein